jgi:parallel beta-helix repeat protein
VATASRRGVLGSGAAALAIAATLWSAPGQAATCTHYVSPTGNDRNGGTTLATAFQTLNRAAMAVPAGGTVCVTNGTYGSNITSGAVLDIRRSGSSTAYTTYMAYPGHHPIIKVPSNSWNGILMQGVHHIIIDGFEVVGQAQNVSSTTANAYKYNTSYMPTNQSGIGVNRFSGQATPHHIIIRNNKVHHNSCGGVSVTHADYITIENNEVYANSWWSPYSCSGISIYESQAVDGAGGYKVVVRNNTSHDNVNYIPNKYAGVITDGNGIIIDDNRNTQGPGNDVVYPARTKVENNVLYKNGGSGAHAFYSEHVDFLNNTSFWNYNGRTNTNGEIFANGSADVVIMNNVMYGSGGVVKKTWTSNIGPVTFDYNVYWNGTVAGAGPNDLKANPNFASLSPTSAGFLYLSGTSTAAQNNGTLSKAPTTDRNSKARGTPPDRGAYEY